MLSKLFRKKNKEKIDNNLSFSLLVDVDTEENVSMELIMYDRSKGIPFIIAKTIYAINNGLLLPHMLNMLNNRYESEPEYKNIIADIITELNDLYNLKYSSKPMIKPTETFTSKILDNAK